ncbi:MAG: hypothetical protein K2K67_01455, partial [Treponemataceae bacterium]|nr:hypothetical protein [Treponemataceae bacterium]
VFCVLCSVFCVLCSVFCVLCSVFCVLCSIMTTARRVSRDLAKKVAFFVLLLIVAPGVMEKV